MSRHSYLIRVDFVHPDTDSDLAFDSLAEALVPLLAEVKGLDWELDDDRTDGLHRAEAHRKRQARNAADRARRAARKADTE